MTRLFFGFSFIVMTGLAHAAASDTYPQVLRDSVFIQRLLQQQLSVNRQDRRIATLVLSRTGNLKDAEALDQFEKRRLLARFLGEPFEFSGTLEQAIETERAAEPLEQVIARALASVTVAYESPDRIPPQPTPQSTLLGNGIWATDSSNTAIEMPMVIRHSLHVSATTIGIQIGKRGPAGPQPYYLFLTCKPANRTAFAPGVSQPALCAGSGAREGMSLAIPALLERQIPSPLPVYSFMTREADLYGDYLRINDEDHSAIDAAAMMVASARCEDLGNCEAVAKSRAAARWSAARPGVLIALTIAVFLLAVFAAGRVPPRENTGWFVSSLSVLVIAVSLLAILVLFQVTAPGLGVEGLAYYAFLIFGLVPHIACVGIIASSLAGGRATRLRVFAVTFGVLTAVLIFTCVILFGR